MRNEWKQPAAIALLLIAAGGTTAVAPRPAPQNLVELLPSGPLLVLEAADFSALWQSWNRSVEKRLWLESDNYRAFSRSRLFLRLKDVREEFAAAAGLSPNLDLVNSVAGTESALALYDIGALEFLYVTRLPEARVMQSALWQLRGDFEPREAAGISYYVRTDERKKRVVAFAAAQDFLLLATREELLASALVRLSGEGEPSAADDPWYRQSVGAASAPGSLRLVLNFAEIQRTPHFRSYWVQRNYDALRDYKAILSDLHFAGGELREERIFLRELDGAPFPPQQEASEGEGASLAELLRLVPDDAGLYRAWAAPSREQVVDLLASKFLDPTGQATARRQSISSRASTDTMELRIDQAPKIVRTGGFAPEEIKRQLDAVGVEAMLHVQSSRRISGGVFVASQTAVALRGKTEWNPKEICDALAAAIETLWTASGLGTRCVPKQSPQGAYHAFDGLANLVVAARGHELIVATHADLLGNLLARTAAPRPSQSGDYAAGFHHAGERAAYMRTMQRLDHLWTGGYAASTPERERPPQFFSDNIGSLSRTLSRVKFVSIVVRERGGRTFQTIRYRLEE